jgi:hypothetical protein
MNFRENLFHDVREYRQEEGEPEVVLHSDLSPRLASCDRPVLRL